jgi:hypothetical protein
MVKSLLMGTRATDAEGRQNRGKTGLCAEKIACEKDKFGGHENRRIDVEFEEKR